MFRMPVDFDPSPLVVSGNHRTLAERAFSVLHGAIITGLLVPGERLPIQDLARTLEMSPMPIREALRRLDAVGLVENIPHRGARVTELSGSDLQQIYDARLALEVLAVRRAADVFSDDAASEADSELAAYRAALGDRDELKALAAHTRFHFTLYREAHSEWLVRLIRPAWESSERYRLAIPIAPLEKRLKEHDRILDACVAHQPDVAAAELHNHLTGTANLLAEQMGLGQLFELVKVPSAPTRRRRGSATLLPGASVVVSHPES
jgi:DNA-binding GntR family transcriptional regulator